MNSDIYPIMILGIIVLLLLLFFFCYSIIVSRIVKKRDFKLEEEMKNVINRVRLESLIIINEIININRSELAEFKPSVGKKKISEIQSRAKKVVDFFFIDNHFFRSLLLVYEELEELDKLVLLLKKTKSNLWDNHLKTKFLNAEKELSEDKNNLNKEYKLVSKELSNIVKEIYWGNISNN